MLRLKVVCLTLALSVATVLAIPVIEHAQESGGVTMEPTSGRETTGALQYRAHCASCHGPTGKGDGPVAAALAQKPTNLTLLAKNNNGQFPKKKVEAYIDGSAIVAAHGNREMPVWGFVFSQPRAAAGTPAGLTPRETQQRIQSVVAYIRSIQEK